MPWKIIAVDETDQEVTVRSNCIDINELVDAVHWLNFKVKKALFVNADQETDVTESLKLSYGTN